jgi:hypothetical protein
VADGMPGVRGRRSGLRDAIRGGDDVVVEVRASLVLVSQVALCFGNTDMVAEWSEAMADG